MRLAIILLQACLEMQLAFMNHFPLFALMLRAKDPWRLPGTSFRFNQELCLMRITGGIYFSIETRKDENAHVLSVKVRRYCTHANNDKLMPILVRVNLSRSPLSSSNIVCGSFRRFPHVLTRVCFTSPACISPCLALQSPAPVMVLGLRPACPSHPAVFDSLQQSPE